MLGSDQILTGPPPVEAMSEDADDFSALLPQPMGVQPAPANAPIHGLPQDLVDQTLEELLRVDQTSVSSHPVYPTFIRHIDEWTDGGLWPGTLSLICARPNFGKCLGKGTRIIMANGTMKTVEDIQVGDQLMGPDSAPRTVLSLARGREMMYWVHQNRGMSYRVNESHILSLKRSKQEGSHQKGEILDISVREILQQRPASFLNRWKGYKVGIEMPEQRLLHIDPYFLGLWLGDGKSTDSRIYNTDREVVDYLYSYAAERGNTVSVGDTSRACPSYALIGGAHPMITALRAEGVIGNKRIPDAYLRTTRANRLRLLAGLIDSDGHFNGSYEIVTKHEALARDIKWLCDSLGLQTRITTKVAKSQRGTKSLVYRVFFNGHLEDLPVSIERKLPALRSYRKEVGVTGIRIEPDCMDDYYGFVIDGDHRFLLEDFTVTHNTAILYAMGSGLLQNRDVLLVSLNLDDAKRTFYGRFMASVAKLRISHVTNAQHRTQGEEVKYQAALQAMRNIAHRLVVLGANDTQCRIDIIKQKLEDIFDRSSMTSGERPQLVILFDSPRNLSFTHVQGLTGNQNAMTEHSGRQVKALLDMHVNGTPVEPIIISTEHLKKLDKTIKRPGADDLKDSIGPQYDANMILMLWNDLCNSTTITHDHTELYFNRDGNCDSELPRDPLTGDYVRNPILELALSKNKMGPMDYNSGSGIALFKFYQEQSRVVPIDDPNEYTRYADLIK